MRIAFRLAAFCLVSSLADAASAANGPPTDSGWPRSFRSGADTVTIYQPQLDSWDGNRLESHMAVSIKTQGSDETVFGVVSLSARTDVDKTSRLVTLADMSFPRIHFPSAPERAAPFRKAIEARVAAEPQMIALDRLEAALQILRAERKGGALPVRNEPPRILFSSHPALLVLVSGEPVLRPVPDSKLRRVVNTSAIILADEGGTLYLHLFDGWMTASTISGPWKVAGLIGPLKKRQLEAVLKKIVEARQGDPLTGTKAGASGGTKPSLAKGPVPEVIVATSPTELIVTEGAAAWVPIDGTELLYVKNTSGRVFRHLRDQKLYVLVAGRWFRAAGEPGPWAFVPGTELPKDFALIPDDSPMENVKAAVPGTPQAEEAVIANSIPQTASVRKAGTKLTVTLDGDPKLAPIDGTPLHYVVNASVAVIRVDEKSWYACQNGVWFAATSLVGPWAVAATVPAVIYSIPPSSPLHSVTYVRVYSSTPEVVYVGYTPGYTGSIVVGDVVVYGTGYTYTAWVGTIWYPVPVTYGYCVNIGWTPWYGWGYAAGYGYAWGWGGYYVGTYYPYGAAVGPYGGAAVWGPGGWAGTTGNVYGTWGDVSGVTRASGGYNAWTGDAWAGQSGAAYNSRTGNAAAGQRGAVGNVYTGNYAAGSRGVVTNTNSGLTVAGAGGTVGNVYTGESVSGGRGAVYNPNTGEATTYAGAHGDEGVVARVGDDVYATKDGEVYRRGDSGWEQYGGKGEGWSQVGDQNRTRSLDSQKQARGAGEQRWSNFRSSGGGGRLGGGQRSAPSRGGGGRRR